MAVAQTGQTPAMQVHRDSLDSLEQHQSCYQSKDKEKCGPQDSCAFLRDTKDALASGQRWDRRSIR
eukprot:705748-Amphidinium_carterae.1